MERRIVDPTLTQTVAHTPAAPNISHVSSTSSVDEGRFVAGTLLGGRYRIIGLLGRGGMGEVYRATDLTLGQSVALKFLPAESAGNNRLLERFAGEVRVARQVSHPNVCRVYDLGEIDGAPYISMEYVDGEDLSSLLTRIGRLPADKAVETARKICAGLSAAHDKGIIHRDLKPQNIMMNKRGEVVIMDFGLAAIADQLSGAEARNGTPAYMAPEQLKGAEVTSRSDIYALGLVLYELFTGKRPYNASTVPQLLSQQESAQLTSMTSLAADIDPTVEKAIRRCLDPDPLKRPANALSVAAALPGGDPLAAALAAGETPSPELVAAAGTVEGMPLKYSIPCLLAVMIAVLAMPAIRQNTLAMMHGSLDYSPEVLAQKGRDIASAMGYAKKPADTQLWLENRYSLLGLLRSKPRPHAWEEWLASEAPIIARYRESPSPLLAPPFGYVDENNPAAIARGMVYEQIDGHGLLRQFFAVPYEEPTAQVDPETVFQAAGLDLSTFVETTPTLVPEHASDQIRAWKGPHPVIPNTELWVQIASWKGRVTQAMVEFPYNRTGGTATEPQAARWRKLVDYLLLAAKWSAGFFGILLARGNWKKNRVDKKGAGRVAATVLILGMISWAGKMHPVAGTDLFSLLLAALGDALLSAVMLWVVYLALEPAVRARWPHAIVTWNRALAGRWADAQVGSHVLIGASLGSVIVGVFVAQAFARHAELEAGPTMAPLLNGRAWIASIADLLNNALSFGLLAFFAIFGLRVLLKRDWLAALVAAVLFTSSESDVLYASDFLSTAAIYIAIYILLAFVLLRVGLVSTISMMIFVNCMTHLIIGTDVRSWWFSYGLAWMMFAIGIAVYAFWRSIGTREIIE